MGERGGEGVKGGCNREDGLGPVLPQVCIRNIQLRLSGVVRAAVAALSNRSFVFSMIRFFGGKKLRQILVDAQRVTDSDGRARGSAAYMRWRGCNVECVSARFESAASLLNALTDDSAKKGPLAEAT
jgi:hypothetical protein